MISSEQYVYEKLDICAQVSAVYLENLKPLRENLKGVLYWRGIDSIQLWTAIEGWRSDLDLETILDAEIVIRSQFPTHSFRFHILIPGSPAFEQLRKAIPDDAMPIYPQPQFEGDRDSS